MIAELIAQRKHFDSLEPAARMEEMNE